MKPDRADADESVYRACITWNVPALRNTGREDVELFKRAIELHPLAFGDKEPLPKRMTPLRRAAEGLKAELTGEVAAA